MKIIKKINYGLNLIVNELLDGDYHKIIRLFGYIKNNIGPYRYIILIFFVLGYNYNGNNLSINRLIRFFLICVMILMYKKYHNYIKDTKIANINVKGIYCLMYINIIQNPVLYIIGKGDLYLYEIQDFLNKYNKYKSFNMIIMLLLINLSMPIKILLKKYYLMLFLFKKLTLGELLFIRIYGLIFSILIFSNIIQYIYKIMRSIGHLLFFIYIILYVISIMYTIYNYVKRLIKQHNIFNIKINNNNVLSIQEIYKKIKKMLLLKYVKNYVDMISGLTIYNIYQTRLEVSSTSYLIAYYILNIIKNEKKGKLLDINIMEMKLFKLYIYKIPHVWRYILYRMLNLYNIVNKINLNEKTNLQVSYLCDSLSNNCISYIDKKNFGYLDSLQLNKFGKFLDYNNNKYLYYYIYEDSFFLLDAFLISLESLIYYKYYNYKKAYIEYSDGMYNETENMSIQEYEYAYKLYVLILKNILHFIGTFEYNYYEDKNKYTKLYVIKDVLIQHGLHINIKDSNKIFYGPLIAIKEDYLNKKNNKLNDKKYESVYESNYLISNIKGIVNYGVYINYKNNLGIKDLHIIYEKYKNKFESNNGYPNLLSDLKPVYIDLYFLELNNIIKQIYQEGDMRDPYNIFDKRDVYYELVNHLKKINA